MQDFEVIIVGAGPAGSSLAHLLGKVGMKVLLIDRRIISTKQVWKGFLSRRAENELWFEMPKGIIDSRIDKICINLRNSKRELCLGDHDYVGSTIVRPKLDAYLRETAENTKNVTFMNKDVVNITHKGDSYTVFLNNGETYSCKYLVGADGYNSIVYSKIFGYKIDQTLVHYIVHMDCDLDKSVYKNDTMHFYVGDGIDNIYRIIFPIGGSHIVRNWLPTQEGNDIKGRYGEDALYQTLFVGANNGRNGLGNAILIGDAGHLIDPLSGEGLTGTFHSFKMAFKAFQDIRGTNQTLGKVYDSYMKDRYTELFLKTKMFQHFSKNISILDEHFLLDYFNVTTGKLDFTTFSDKYSKTFMPGAFYLGKIKSLFGI